MSYIGNEPIVSATRTITEVTATAGQTVFTANGGYTVGYIDVFLNGAQLQTVDFTATNGTTITLTEAAQVGDVIRLVAWGTFLASNGVALVGNSNITGNINVSGNLGVGTTSPTAQLQINRSGTGDYTSFRLSNSGASGRIYEIGLGGNTAAAGYANNLYFYDSTAGALRMAVDSSGNLLFNSGYGSVATAYGCRAWVNFNGTGTPSIRASGNVSSITDNGTGQFTVNFTTAMPDANYGFALSGQRDGDNGSGTIVSLWQPTPLATGSIRISIINQATTALDSVQIGVAVFR